MRYYKHFEVFLHGQDSIVVTGLTRAQVSRYAKQARGEDVIIDVKPISIKSVEAKYGKEFKQIVFVNTISLTPPDTKPYISEDMKTEINYDYYQVTLVGYEDEPEIFMCSSIEAAKKEAKEKYGTMLKSVARVTGYDLASEVGKNARKQFNKNINTLSGNTEFKLSTELGEASSPFRKKINSIKEGEPMVQPRTVRNPQNKDLDEACWKGYKQVGMKDKGGKKVPNCVPEEKNPIMEGEDKLMYLARIGLMDKSEVAILRRAIALKKNGQPLSIQNRDILLKLMERLVQLVTRHTHMFNQARRKVMEEVINEVEDRITSEMWNNLMDYFSEAGYMDPPRTPEEIKKKFPNIKTDVKNKNSIDLQPVIGK